MRFLVDANLSPQLGTLLALEGHAAASEETLEWRWQRPQVLEADLEHMSVTLMVLPHGDDLVDFVIRGLILRQLGFSSEQIVTLLKVPCLQVGNQAEGAAWYREG